ncbi:arylsulfatase [Polyangium sp. rjm3]|uniref:Arylsulfatase n=1 Tax=Polyangium mundeleinium TaxID=2995306 RepID=A0ABT5F096_9BACT|nr:arylsulfatase [Polyangium mundeleinium]MDC0747500.1 arylsulfatase [Polyangium mundeleinium]
MKKRAIPTPQREILPLPDRPYVGPLPYDTKDPDAEFPPIERIRPPEGAPNILVVLLDDVGFGATSAFGGPCRTTTAERLAAGGLKYTRFHTTALCSPTRAALLTGRNHHSVGMGVITELATTAPGYTTRIPNTAANIAKILKYNGYATAQFGKCHEIPVWETGPAGPFERWPTHNGFETFYGFVGGETNQWFPEVYEGTRRIKTPDDPAYHFMPDMTDRAIAWIRTQAALARTPFFAYFAPGAAHAPHHVPKAWADRYTGQFDEGWDALRERIFARQKSLFVIPEDAKLTLRPAEIPAWNDMPKALLPVLARQMEVYAGFLEYTDHHVGRLLDALVELGLLDDTLILYILGDNGASAEGTLQGTFNEMINFNGMSALETPEFLAARIDELGGRAAYNHYAAGWAHALDTPYPWVKQVASHWGGTRNGMLVHWPAKIAARGELRAQFHHVIDVVPTLLEAAGLPAPVMVEGVQQKPLEGVSMLYSFDDAAAPDRHVLQYFEMVGNRGIYHEGWTAVTKHRTPWELVGEAVVSFDDDKWELYDTTRDWTEAEDLAAHFPEKLHELQRLFLIEAARHDVLPLDNRGLERVAEESGLPRIVHGTSQCLFDGMELNVQRS